MFVPIGYSSGTALSATDTYSGQTLVSLGLTAGTYTWTWGTGADADSLTVNIGVASVPEPSSLALAGRRAGRPGAVGAEAGRRLPLLGLIRILDRRSPGCE